MEPESVVEINLNLAEELIADIGTKPPPFAEEMAAWAEEYGVSFEATTALSKILARNVV